MIIRYHPTFRKQYMKLPAKIQKQFDSRVLLLISNPANRALHIHPLKGKYIGYWSMNVSGDFRALFRRTGDEIIIFGLIGSHSDLYG